MQYLGVCVTAHSVDLQAETSRDRDPGKRPLFQARVYVDDILIS